MNTSVLSRALFTARRAIRTTDTIRMIERETVNRVTRLKTRAFFFPFIVVSILLRFRAFKAPTIWHFQIKVIQVTRKATVKMLVKMQIMAVKPNMIALALAPGIAPTTIEIISKIKTKAEVPIKAFLVLFVLIFEIFAMEIQSSIL